METLDRTPSGTRFVLRAVALGIVAGSRTMLPAALLSYRRAGREDHALGARIGRLALPMLALGELVGDKLPHTPSRLSAVQLVGRLVSGARAGATVARDARGAVWLGALVGGVSALASAHAGFYARAAVVKATGVPDPVVAVVEDAVAIGLGTFATATS